MTIRRGEPWGVEVARPDDLTVVDTDRDMASTAGPVGVSDGDLYRSIGSPAPRDPVQQVDIDGFVVELDHDREVRGVAHAVVRRSWWRGTVIACMNVDHRGTWNVAPRAHPNDGRLDVVECAPSMSLRDRWAAYRRLPQGTHLPHPDLDVSRVAERSWTFERPHTVWVDGIEVGRARAVTVRIVPDRYTLLF